MLFFFNSFSCICPKQFSLIWALFRPNDLCTSILPCPLSLSLVRLLEPIHLHFLQDLLKATLVNLRRPGLPHPYQVRFILLCLYFPGLIEAIPPHPDLPQPYPVKLIILCPFLVVGVLFYLPQAPIRFFPRASLHKAVKYVEAPLLTNWTSQGK